MCPIFEYECEKCEMITEYMCKWSDQTEVLCDSCGFPAHRIMSTYGWDLKGDGWFNKD